MDKYIGRLLDNRYEILEVLGTGGMAVVYKARCHRLNRLVAIKILKDDYMEDEEFRRRFHSESQAVAMLSHPNIVSIYDVSSSVTADYIVMELIDGITLKQYMEKKGVLNWKETLHFAIQIAKALEHAHGRGIVHRDIKPHNVMVLKNGSVKVTDFGIARMMSKGNTLTKEALGSVHYISPEQAKGGRVDSRSDIYSLGVVMYEMMSGRPPYDGDSPVAVAIQHINGGAALPSTLNPNIPGGLEQIIMKAMAHDPVKRFGSASIMLKDMDEFRKYPSTLFDYNTPPTDEVTKLQRSAILFETKQTNAEKREPFDNTNQDPVEQQTMKSAEKGTSKPGPSGQSGLDVGNRPRERKKPVQKPQKGGNTAAIAVIACSIAIILALIVFLVIQFSGDDTPELVKVPDLVGENYKLHQQHSGFEIKINDYIYSDEFPADTIIDQTPSAGTEVEKNTTIYINVSRGKQTEPQYMPDHLVDMEKSKATELLDKLNMGFTYVYPEEYHETIAAGRVIRTEPDAGTELQNGIEIKIVVSKGREIVSKSVPGPIQSVIDWDPESDIELPPSLNADEAKAMLEAMNLDLDFANPIKQSDDKYKEGDLMGITVVRKDPQTGKRETFEGDEIQSLKTGDEITLYVSLGPQCGIMPDLRNKNKTEAHELMQDAELKYVFKEHYSLTVKENMVISQSVEAGTEVPISQKVEIIISLGPDIRDVVLDLGSAEFEKYIPEEGFKEGVVITVSKGDAVIADISYSQFVDNKFTLKDQEGVGKVDYTVTITDDAIDGDVYEGASIVWSVIFADNESDE